METGRGLFQHDHEVGKSFSEHRRTGGGRRQQHFDNLVARGVTTVTCIYNARTLGEDEHLRAAEFEARAIGPELG